MNKRYPKLIQKINSYPTSTIFVCSIVKAEMLYGSHKSNRILQNLTAQNAFWSPFDSLPFDDVAASYFEKERARLERLGTPIGMSDLLIASIALANNVILVTNNTREFSRVNGLQIEDWLNIP
jgi:tRNA(fMet)-specific endonuclease VapC